MGVWAGLAADGGGGESAAVIGAGQLLRAGIVKPVFEKAAWGGCCRLGRSTQAWARAEILGQRRAHFGGCRTWPLVGQAV